jgi:hypothetical protein
MVKQHLASEGEDVVRLAEVRDAWSLPALEQPVRIAVLGRPVALE